MQPLSRKTNQGVINLRGHHLICTHTFSGAGYDAAFIDNMHRIVEARRVPSQPIKVVTRSDDVCECCPHANGVSCGIDDTSASDMDRATLSALGLKLNTVFSSAYLHGRVEAGLDNGLFHAICGECSWFDACRQILYARNSIESILPIGQPDKKNHGFDCYQPA